MDIQLQNQLRRLVEVTATIGLIKMSGQRPAKLKKYRDKLEAYAFPNELAEKINEETKDNFEKFQGKMKDWGTE